MLTSRFPLKEKLILRVLPNLIQNTKHMNVLFILAKCIYVLQALICECLWELMMFFVLDINFLDVIWKPKHVTLELFEEIKIGGQTLLKKSSSFL